MYEDLARTQERGLLERSLWSVVVPVIVANVALRALAQGEWLQSVEQSLRDWLEWVALCLKR